MSPHQQLWSTNPQTNGISKSESQRRFWLYRRYISLTTSQRYHHENSRGMRTLQNKIPNENISQLHWHRVKSSLWGVQSNPYIRSILDDIAIPQNRATTLFKDNKGALLVANSDQPTKRTRHMDTKYFAIQHCVNTDLLVLKVIATCNNESDVMTKNMNISLFYRQIDHFIRKMITEYARAHTDLWLQHYTLRYQNDRQQL